MWVEMAVWGVLGVGVWDGAASVALAVLGESGCVDAPPPSPEKKSGAPSNDPGARLFISPPHPDQK